MLKKYILKYICRSFHEKARMKKSIWTYDILMLGSAVILGWFILLVIPRGLVDRSNEDIFVYIIIS